MENIKNIIFDLGGVILNLDIQKTTDALIQLGGQNFHDLFHLGHAASFFKEYECGRINDQEFISAIRDKLNKQVPDEVVLSAWNAMLLDFPAKRIDFLKSLRSKYRLFLFSNTNAIHLEAFRKIYHNTFSNGSLDDLFEKAYYSHLLQMRKPDKESYQYILDENGLTAGETLFIDDALVNIEGAALCGIQTYHLQAPRTIEDIEII